MGVTVRGEEGFGALGSSSRCASAMPPRIALPFLPQSGESSSHPSLAAGGGGVVSPTRERRGNGEGAGLDGGMEEETMESGDDSKHGGREVINTEIREKKWKRSPMGKRRREEKRSKKK